MLSVSSAPRRVGASLALLLIAGAASSPAPASAQSRAELAEARDLFTQGLEAAREARWVDARDLFERSLAITERTSTLLNLAAALAETGALLDSARRYERFLELATGRDRRLRPEAEAALERVRARTPRLALDDAALAPGDRVELDGDPVGEAARAAPIALDPGAHHVAVRRDGAVVFEQHVSLAEGASERLVLTPRAVVPTPREVAEAVEPADEGGGDDGVAIGVGVGVAVAVVAAVVIVVAIVLSGETPPPHQGNLGGGVIRY